ncbi:MAG: HEPN domain-containing protein [Bacteroidales bacterium]|jgi:HEPN domain-containing protein|nr:HEPN domain-containing protein [Bacteroidales bacterium]
MADAFDTNRQITYWITSSDSDYQTMKDLFATQHYNWSLFMGHLVIEKLLKAYYIQQNNEHPPLIHDLRRIGEKAGLNFPADKKEIVDTITRFNIRARYDDYKNDFYNLCTKEFTSEWFDNIIKLQQWIKMMLLK